MAKAIAFVLVIVVSIDSISSIREKHMTSNVTQTLDYLLASNRYDKRLRPGFGGSPITISVNFIIKSMGPVSDNDQSYGLDCYFRQNWYDVRLRFQKIPGLEELSMSWLFLDRVWKPDTYFVNGKRSYLHRITVPNKFLRLRHDGYITYSMRLTITASCPMYLRKFPLDAQRCPLILGSYGYSNKDLVYKWTDVNPIGLQEGVEIAQFDLVNITTEDEKIMIKGGFSYSTLKANFWLKRHTGYFMLQVYVPCGLIVLSSWVSFWIDPDDVAARVALGVTTVLSLTTMGFGGRAQLPKVSYWTALDWFVIICFTSVFSVMIEYAIVNFIDKFKKDLKKLIQTRKQTLTKEYEAPKKTESLKAPGKRRERAASFSFFWSKPETDEKEEDIKKGEIFVEVYPEPDRRSSLINLDVIRSLPRRLSTTVTEYLKTTKIRFRSKSISDLRTEKREENEEEVMKGEEEKKEKPPPPPKIIVSSAEEDLIDLYTEPGRGEEVTDAEQNQSEVGDVIVEVETKEKIRWESLEDVKEKKLDIIAYLRRFLKKVKILPGQSSMIRLIESSEPPNKFSSIDVHSRINFPIAFAIALVIYLFAFSYYLTDEIPSRDSDLFIYKQ